MVRLCFISDTHEKHWSVTIPQCDILVHAGDITYLGDPHKIRDFDAWCADLKAKGIVKEIVCIVGNHELTFDPDKQDYREGMAELFTNCHYLQDSSIELMGLKFYGSPHTPFFYDWAFNVYPDKIKEKWDLIPSDLDVLITHGPPHKILDMTPRGEAVGCKELAYAVDRAKPKIHVFGHIHLGHGEHIFNGTHFINASTCTEQYQPTNTPIVVDYEK